MKKILFSIIAWCFISACFGQTTTFYLDEHVVYYKTDNQREFTPFSKDTIRFHQNKVNDTSVEIGSSKLGHFKINNLKLVYQKSDSTRIPFTDKSIYVDINDPCNIVILQQGIVAVEVVVLTKTHRVEFSGFKKICYD